MIEGESPRQLPPWFKWDRKVERWRTLAFYYRRTLDWFGAKGIPLKDSASNSPTVGQPLKTSFEPFPYQKEAIKAWRDNKRRGSIVLPTGAGKSLLALQAIEDVRRGAIVVAPTIDLMSQWYALLRDAFACEIGILGGGYHEIMPITVTTYDSAYIYMTQYGNLFSLLIFDEVHHLPSPGYIQIAETSIAPFRLGLTATYEREDGREAMLDAILGPVLYRAGVKELKGRYLSDYQIVRLRVELTPKEEKAYEAMTTEYHGFIKEENLTPYGQGWKRFIRMSSEEERARRALISRRGFKRLIAGAERKLETLDSLLKQHRDDKVIVFTEDNDMVYHISREFLLPAITHETKAKERKVIMDGFKKGLYPAVVTSRVLNEGVDVPEAKVAIILGGTASKREHLQRLGRILRKRGDTKAVLYEVVTIGTSERSISFRRRKGEAYEG